MGAVKAAQVLRRGGRLAVFWAGEAERGGVLTDLAVLPGRRAGHPAAEQEGGEGGPVPPHPPANPRVLQQRRVP